ncbi:MAG: alpha/beta fold hydrolase [Actinomycetes bacterium]
MEDRDERLPDGTRLAVRRADGPLRPFLLVHGLSSNARLWDGVAGRLADAGHEVVAVDLRGHGRSEQVSHGHSTDQAAADLAALSDGLGLTGEREPIVAGQSWGGNVVVALAARHRGVSGLALVDGGWIALGERFATFEDCWAVLAPPVFDGVRLEQLAQRFRTWHPDWPEQSIQATLANFIENPDGTASPRLAREHHREILRSLWESDVRTLYPLVDVPALLAPALSADADHERREGPRLAAELLPDAEVAWYDGADHDIHAQHPGRLTTDLLALAARVEARDEARRR